MVHTGRPSWHQARAGHISSGITSGFESKEEAEKYITNFKKRHPNEPAFAVPETKPRGK